MINQLQWPPADHSTKQLKGFHPTTAFLLGWATPSQDTQMDIFLWEIQIFIWEKGGT